MVTYNRKIDEFEEEYIRLRNEQSRQIVLAGHEKDEKVAKKIMQEAVTSYTERLGQLAKSLRSFGIDPATL